jgi:SAM-dependent methyltransferase
MQARYDDIGRCYSATRREDPAVKTCVMAALDGTHSVLNVGAGAGAYEPVDRDVIAVEPSRVMNAQRTPLVLRARADRLPLRDQSVDGAMVILSLHHWDEAQEQGVRELRRVTRGPIVIATVDADVGARMWLPADYMPEASALDRRIFPAIDEISGWLGGRTHVQTLEVPRDTPDWTLMSFWAHPERVLDPRARSAVSGFARMPAEVVARVVEDVRRDLESGVWDARHGHLRMLTAFDVGFRMLVNLPECHREAQCTGGEQRGW